MCTKIIQNLPEASRMPSSVKQWIEGLRAGARMPNVQAASAAWRSWARTPRSSSTRSRASRSRSDRFCVPPIPVTGTQNAEPGRCCQCRNKTPAFLPVLTTTTTSPSERLVRLFLLTLTEICTTIEEVGEAEATAGEHRQGKPDWTHRGR
jgi:hypothetical protein